MMSLRMSTGKEMKRDRQKALRDFGCFQLKEAKERGKKALKL